MSYTNKSTWARHLRGEIFEERRHRAFSPSAGPHRTGLFREVGTCAGFGGRKRPAVTSLRRRSALLGQSTGVVECYGACYGSLRNAPQLWQ